MSDGVIIAAMICVTVLAICWIEGRKENKKGGQDNGNN